jgi:tRNA nucleotidyltransferase (CCA-adding enzyme)
VTDPVLPVPLKHQADLAAVKKALAPYTDRAYFVGGQVRDFYLQRPSEDVDIEVYDIAPGRFDDLMTSLGAQGVGRSFFVYKLGGLDLSLPRSERQIGPRHQDFAVNWCNDPKKASSRRDFTINTLMVNIFSGEPLDFHGGLRDLKAGRIVHMADDAFREDALRVLRAARFSAQLGFKVAPQTARLCRQMSLSALPDDRIRKELEKIFSASFLARGLYVLMQLGIDRQLLGETIGCATLRRVTRSLQRIGTPEEPIGPLLLPWLLRQHGRYRVDRLCAALRLTQRDCRALKVLSPLPMRANSRFLLALSLRLPIKRWPGSYLARWQERAQTLGVWQSPFNHGVVPLEVAKEGYQGAAIGREIKRRISSQIRKQDGKPLPTFN